MNDPILRKSIWTTVAIFAILGVVFVTKFMPAGLV